MTALKEQDKNTISTLLRATARYAYNRIDKAKNRRIYRDAMNMCLGALEKPDVGSTSDMLAHIEHIAAFGNDSYRWSVLSPLNNEKKRYFLLACEHAIGVIKSVDFRFISGGHDNEPRALRGRGVYIYEDEGIF